MVGAGVFSRTSAPFKLFMNSALGAQQFAATNGWNGLHAVVKVGLGGQLRDGSEEEMAGRGGIVGGDNMIVDMIL